MAIPLQVDETGDRLCYWVHSEAKPRNVYRVDLLAHGGFGECTCPWFRTRIWPALRDGEMTVDTSFPHPDKHVRAARNHFLLHLLKSMGAEEQPSYQ